MLAEARVSHEHWEAPPASTVLRSRILTSLASRAAVVTAGLYAIGYVKALVLSRAWAIPLDAVLGSLDATVASGALGVFYGSTMVLALLMKVPLWLILPIVMGVALLYTMAKDLSGKPRPRTEAIGWSDRQEAIWNRWNYRVEYWTNLFQAHASSFTYAAVFLVLGPLAAASNLKAVDEKLSKNCLEDACETYLRADKRPVTGIQVGADPTNIYVLIKRSVVVVRRDQLLEIVRRRSAIPALHGVDAFEDLGIAFR